MPARCSSRGRGARRAGPDDRRFGGSVAPPRAKFEELVPRLPRAQRGKIGRPRTSDIRSADMRPERRARLQPGSLEHARPPRSGIAREVFIAEHRKPASRSNRFEPTDTADPVPLARFRREVRHSAMPQLELAGDRMSGRRALGVRGLGLHEACRPGRRDRGGACAHGPVMTARFSRPIRHPLRPATGCIRRWRPFRPLPATPCRRASAGCIPRGYLPGGRSSNAG